MMRPGARVLIIEDDELAATAMQCVLDGWGIDCAVAADASSAPGIAAGFQPDAIVSDYRLPDGTGTEAVAAVRARLGRSVAAVILTGEIGHEPDQDAAALGIEVIRKPITATHLANTIRELLGAMADC